MKYHDKLNLKSPVYKYNNHPTSKTPQKSPLKIGMNPSDLFQKVCCPNCKYSFKIIKQQVLKELPIQNSTSKDKKLKRKEKRQIQTQTEGILTQTKKNSPLKSANSQVKLQKTYQFNLNGSASTHQQFNHLDSLIQAQNRQNRYLRESDFKFKPLSVSPNNKLTKSKTLLKTLDTKKFRVPFDYPNQTQTPKANAYENQNKGFWRSDAQENHETNLFYQQKNINDPYSPKKSSEMLSEKNVKFIVPSEKGDENMESLQKAKSSSSINISHKQRGLNKQVENQQINFQKKQETALINSNAKISPQLQTFVKNILIKNQQSENVITQLKSFCKQVAEEVQVPSYFKMLALTQ